MKPIRLLAASALFGSIATFAWAQSQVMSGQDFAAAAASSDMFEIQSSQLALEKAQNDSVKEFAQMMIDDHTKASEELKAAAEKDGVTVPTEMDEKHKAQLGQLNSAPADGFDAAYVTAQKAAHEEGVTLMTSFAESGQEAALKAHAAKTAPIIQTHLEHVQKLQAPQ